MWIVILAACGSPPAPVQSPLPTASVAEAAPIEVPSGKRLVAVGDLHGDTEAALTTLRLAGIVDAEGRWAGGDATFVQTGDTTDRGPDSKGVLDLMRRLQVEAKAAGGRVVPLLGNHEVMNLQGDWRYVSEGDILGFGGVEPRARAFQPTGDYGAWLGTLDAVALVDGTVFCHGGVTPEWAARGIDAINSGVRAAMFQPKSSAEVITDGGPLWYRGYVEDPESEVCDDLERALTSLGAKRMVVGHTTRRDGRIESRCGGRLHVIDTGISAHYGGHVAAWEQVGGDSRALYPAGTEDLPD